MQWAWHVHQNELYELLTEPIEVRREFIKKHKPLKEQEIRLRLLQPVRGMLPQALLAAWRTSKEAWRTYEEAWRTSEEAWRTYEEARRTYKEAWRASEEEIQTLHAIECPDCPWDGTTIFPSDDGREK